MTILCIYHKVDRDRTYYVKCGTIWYFRIGRYRYTIFVTMRHITPKPGCAHNNNQFTLRFLPKTDNNNAILPDKPIFQCKNRKIVK